MTARRSLTIVLALVLAALLALPATGLAAAEVASDRATTDRAARHDAATDRPATDRRVTDRRLDTRTETFQVGRIGVVQITWARTGIVDVDVRARRGWRHDETRNGRNTVRVVFWNGELAVVFTAHLTKDGTLRTAIHRRHVDDERPLRRDHDRRTRAARIAAAIR